MCEHCGCSTPAHPETSGHGHGHDHAHAHGNGHAQASNASAPARRVEVEQRILAQNDEVAAANRAWLSERGIVALNLISAPGSGKTLLLERTLERLQGRLACAVLAGDVQTDRDARRLAGKGAHVHAIETGSSCHVNAAQVRDLLPHVCTEGTRLLFIENVGNLVCPAAFDLGESFKVALLATTEGEDKPVKYPALFSRAEIVVVNKTDLADTLDWDRAACRRFVRQVHPGVFIFELSAKTGEGIDAWIDYLAALS